MDRVLRAMTDDASFRIVALDTTDTTRWVIEAQRADATDAARLADLVTGAILIRETMAPGFRVQAVLQSLGGRGSLIADSHPSGKTRGLVNANRLAGGTSGQGAVLRLMRSLHDGRLHQGVVEVPHGKDVSEALMIYMKESEQIDTVIAVGAVFASGRLQASGGYLVQLLPEVERGPLAVMIQRLEECKSLETQLASATFSPHWLLQELLYAMPHTVLGDTTLKQGCWCNRVSVLSALATLDRREIHGMIEAAELVEISCDYCGHLFSVAPNELRGMADDS